MPSANSNINIRTQICFISFPTSLPVSAIVLTQDPSILLSAPPQISIHYSKTDPVYTISDLETGIRVRKAPDSNEKYHECSESKGDKRNVFPRKWRLNWNPTSANNRLNEAWQEDTPGSWRNMYRARWPGISGSILACLSLWNLPRSKSGIPFWKWSLYSPFSVAHNMLYFPAFFFPFNPPGSVRRFDILHVPHYIPECPQYLTNNWGLVKFIY